MTNQDQGERGYKALQLLSEIYNSNKPFKAEIFTQDFIHKCRSVLQGEDFTLKQSEMHEQPTIINDLWQVLFHSENKGKPLDLSYDDILLISLDLMREAQNDIFTPEALREKCIRTRHILEANVNRYGGFKPLHVAFDLGHDTGSKEIEYTVNDGKVIFQDPERPERNIKKFFGENQAFPPKNCTPQCDQQCPKSQEETPKKEATSVCDDMLEALKAKFGHGAQKTHEEIQEARKDLAEAKHKLDMHFIDNLSPDQLDKLLVHHTGNTLHEIEKMSETIGEMASLIDLVEYGHQILSNATSSATIGQRQTHRAQAEHWLERAKPYINQDTNEEKSEGKQAIDKDSSCAGVDELHYTNFLDYWINANTLWDNMYQAEKQMSPKALNTVKARALAEYLLTYPVTPKAKEEDVTVFKAPGYTGNVTAQESMRKTLIENGYNNPMSLAYQTDSGLRINVCRTNVVNVSFYHPDRLPTLQEIQWVRDEFAAGIKQMAFVMPRGEPLIGSKENNTITLVELINKED